MIIYGINVTMNYTDYPKYMNPTITWLIKSRMDKIDIPDGQSSDIAESPQAGCNCNKPKKPKK